MKQDRDYGNTTNDLSEKYNQVMSLSKMWQTCGVTALSESCKIYGKSGMMRNGILYRLETSVRVTCENGYGLLPTPTATQYGNNQGGANGRSGKVRHSLETMAKIGALNFPTPTTFDSGNPLPPRKKNSSGGQKPPLVSVIGGKLNPQFVEWLMGYPQDHTKTIENNESNSWEIL